MQHVQDHVPVTALAVYGSKYILSGQGTYLLLYEHDGTLLSRTCIFSGQAIHGIAVLDNPPSSTAIIWGGSFLRPLSLTVRDGAAVHILLGEVHTAKDWILDATFTPSNSSLAGFVTAHSALTTVHIRQSKSEPSRSPEATLEPRIPGSNCILYSAHLTWLSAFHCLIASGTSFGDVIVWSAILNSEKNAATQRQVHFSFSAHDGSVFGVRLSSQLSLPDQNIRRVLASCSDDRSVRLWDVSDLTSATMAQPQQDTGFGPRAEAAGRMPRCLAKAMGHISRIWQVRYAQTHRADELMRIQSFGEDACVLTWALRYESSAYVLSLLETVKPHAGKNIWSVATTKSSNLLFTGGADGAIALSRDDLSVTTLIDVPKRGFFAGGPRNEYRCYGFVAPNSLLSTTERGSLILLTLSDSGDVGATEELSAPLDDLVSYSLVRAIPSIAFIGGLNGTIYLYEHAERRVQTLAKVGGKVSGLFAQKQSSGSVAVLACTINPMTASLFHLEAHDKHRSHQTETINLALLLNKGFVTTSFTHCRVKQRNYAVLGSRAGSVAIYSYDGDTKMPLTHAELVTHVHGQETITALLWVEGDTKSECSRVHSLLSTGRDGTVAMHRVTLYGEQVRLETVHQLSLPFGPNIEGISVLDGTGALVWGFRSKCFVVFDLKRQEELMKVECGGVHRNWAFHPASNGGRFVWTKASKLFQYTQSSPYHRTIKLGGHGREIKAASISSTDAEQIIATGAEDTDIKLITIERTGFHCLHTLRRHNTGIQHLEWHGSFLFSSAGFEEFFVWRITRGIPVIGLGVVCEAGHPRSGTSDLRIMGFNVQQEDASQEFLIAMAYSDSSLRHWRYHGRSWELVGVADYLTSCLTQVLGATGNAHSLWTTATDGHLARWVNDLDNRSLAWTHRLKIHQSSIHEIVFASLGGEGSLVITGGDDNAIGITRVTDSGKMETSLIPRAHAAAVTGLAILPLGQGGYGLVSAGIDQRIKLWQIETDISRTKSDVMRVRRLHDVHTAVADVSSVGLCVLKDGGVGVLICGVGMDLWRLPWAACGDGVRRQSSVAGEWQALR